MGMGEKGKVQWAWVSDAVARSVARVGKDSMMGGG
jgi:hypothetical protein